MKKRTKFDIVYMRNYSIILGFLASLVLILGIVFNKGLIIVLIGGFMLLHSLLLLFTVFSIARNSNYIKSYEYTLDERKRIIEEKSEALCFKLSRLFVLSILILGQFFKIPFEAGIISIIVFMGLSHILLYIYYNRKF